MHSDPHHYTVVNGQSHGVAALFRTTDVSISDSKMRESKSQSGWDGRENSMYVCPGKPNPRISCRLDDSPVHTVPKETGSELTKCTELVQNWSKNRLWLQLFTDAPEDKNFVGGVCHNHM
jgi:hypothetical protein